MKLTSLLIMCAIFTYGLYVRNKQVDTNNIKQIEITRHSLFIQGYLNSPILAEITNETALIANKIIKTELDLAPDYDFNFFLPKQKQRLTLYGLNSADISANENLIYPTVNNFFEENKSNLELKKVKLLPDLKLFGENNDELVIMIDDPEHELSKLNSDLKNRMHAINTTYIAKHQTDLYDLTKSEKFEYLPHIGLGRIRVRSIKEHIKDESIIEQVLKRINEQVLQKTLTLITSKLNAHNQKLNFESLCITDLQLHLNSCIKKYNL